MQLLAKHCGFAVPRVLYEDPSGWELRSMVPGLVDSSGVCERVQRDPNYANTLGQDLGRMLADQHLNIQCKELIGWLAKDRNWPQPQDLPFLSQIVNDAGLRHRIDHALQSYACIRREPGASVLVHADLGFHSLAVDRRTFRLTGVFDFEGAICGDRHYDFSYMVFGAETSPMLEGALATYEPATGIKIDPHRVRLLNAVAAIGYLAYRHGHAPEETWCGRTLAVDLAWAQSALGLAGF